MRFQIGIPYVALLLFCGAFSKDSDDDDDEEADHADTPFQLSQGSKYEVIVQMEEGTVYKLWAGVILNNKFVLSVDAFDGKKRYDPKHLTIIVGYTHIGNLNKNSKNTNFAGSKGKYEVEEVIPHRSLLLLQTGPIELNDHVQSINVPTGEFLESWKNPFSIPHNKEFETSFWCRYENAADYNLWSVTDRRKCTLEVCFKNNAVIPGCISMKSKKKHCVLAPGAPYVYRGLLVALRKNMQQMKPLTVLIEDYFINIAVFMKSIDKLMKDETDGSSVDPVSLNE